MEGEENLSYESLKQGTVKEDSEYEMCQTSPVKERRVEQPKNIKKRNNKELMWNKPILHTVLLSLTVILQVGILCLLLVHMSTRDATCTTGDTAGIHNSSIGFSTSCKQIKNLFYNRQSGYYVLASANGSTAFTYTAYCNMEELCGSGGGWTRLAYLDMNDSTVNCPSGFRLYQSRGVRACGRPVTSNGSCVSVEFPSNGISYSQVCGRVTGYQYGGPDVVDIYGSNHTNLNGDYVDGVSITCGSPRQHIWTLMAGFSDSLSSPFSCPCNNGSSVSVQSIIGNNYFCESGNTGSTVYRTLYTFDPLWDGQGCGFNETACCNVPGIPWFHRDYGNTTTTDYIELRVCGDEGTDNEDAPVSYYEIYVK